MKRLDDVTVPIKVKLACLWTSVMFLYIYADYFGLFIPGNLKSMLAGKIAPLGATTQGVLLFTSTMMAIPSLMIFLSVSVPASINRWLNIVAGTLYTIIILITMWSWYFYIVYGLLEIALTLLVVWYAIRWPRVEDAAE